MPFVPGGRQNIAQHDIFRSAGGWHEDYGTRVLGPMPAGMQLNASISRQRRSPAATLFLAVEPSKAKRYGIFRREQSRLHFNPADCVTPAGTKINVAHSTPTIITAAPTSCVRLVRIDISVRRKMSSSSHTWVTSGTFFFVRVDDQDRIRHDGDVCIKSFPCVWNATLLPVEIESPST